jgi:hypothetical protein
MNTNQLATVQNLLNQVEKLDVEKKIADAYPSEPDPAKINLGQNNAEWFIATLNRVVKQFKAELTEAGLGHILPFQYNFQNEYGSSNLQQDLQHLINNITGNNFPAAEGFLKRLVYYHLDSRSKCNL